MKRVFIQSLPELDELAKKIGAFMVYWGFKEIHGRIWCHLFLSGKPLDAGDLIERLGVSKALISISLSDLLEYNVVQELGKGELGTLIYKANDDLTTVICNVLEKREKKMMSSITFACKKLADVSDSHKSGANVSADRMESLEHLITLAEGVLDHFLMASKSGTELQDSFEKFSKI